MKETVKNQLSYSEDNQITIRGRSEMFAVEKRDWKRIKKLINKFPDGQNWWDSQNWWNNFFWFMLATAIAFLIAWITTSESDSNKKYFFIIAFIFSSIIIAILFLVGRESSQSNIVSKKEILEEMQGMELEEMQAVEQNGKVVKNNKENIILFKDDFSDLKNWDCENGNITISDSHLIVTNAGKGCIVKNGESWKDIKFTFKTTIRNSNFSFIVRAKDFDNYVMIQCGVKNIRPHYRKNGKWEVLKEITGLNLWVDKEYRVEVQVKNNTLKLYIDGKEFFYDQNILSDFQNGSVGFRESGNEKADFYDLMVEGL